MAIVVAPVRISKKITIDDNFASLRNITPEGDLEFELSYSVNQSEAISSGVSTVFITTYTAKKKDYSIFENVSGKKALSGDIANNILNMPAALRAVTTANDGKVLDQIISDVTSRINNQIVAFVRSSKFSNSKDSLQRVQQLFKTQVVLKEISKVEDEVGEKQAILQTNRSSLQNIEHKTTVRHSIKNLMLKKGIDPSQIVNQKSDRISAGKNISGVYVPTNKKIGHRWGDDDTSDITNHTFSQILPDTTAKFTSTDEIASNRLMQSIQTVPVDKITVTEILRLTSDKLSASRGSLSFVFIKFEVRNKDGMIVDTIEKELDISFHLRLFNTPKLPPIVKFCRNEAASKGILQIFQQDPKATAVRVYRKYVYHTSNELDDYILIGVFNIAKGVGFASIPIDIARKDTVLYRVIAVNSDGTVGFDYTNIVINPSGSKKNRFRYLSLTTKIVADGVSIDISGIPSGVVSLKVLRKNKTLFEKKYTAINTVMTYIDRMKDAEVYSIVDTQAKDDNYYEYVAELTYRDGLTEQAGYSAVKYIPFVENIVDTKIIDFTTSSDPSNLDVSFGIITKIQDTDLDSVKNLLEKQGLSQFYSSNIANERDKLSRLIAHNVTRVNLTTGIRENFGTITTGKFVDSVFRKINSALPLKQGQQYRYDVVTLLRRADELFDTLEKSAIDATTKKSYTFKPSKFFHPITLKKGNLLEKETQQAHYAESSMTLGSVGDLVTVNVSFNENLITISDISAAKYDKDHILLKWAVSGDKKLVDHFIIILEENGMRAPVGKVQLNDSKMQYEFIHAIAKDEVGDYMYAIIPIFNDYTVGAESKSNKVIVQ